MAKPFGRTLDRRVTLGPQAGDDSKFIVEARVNGGMYTSIDPADIESRYLQDAKNVYVRLDKTVTCTGYDNLTPPKPNSNYVMAVYSYKQNDGEQFTLRFTPTSVHRRTSVDWSALSGTLTGTTANKFNIVTAFDKCIFTNGKDDIQQIDAAVGGHTTLDTGISYKYITAFYNRIVGLDFAPSNSVIRNPAQVGWSAEYPYLDEWNPLVKFSAGSTPLVESPGDFADYGTGIFGLTNVMVILREKSIWLATKQPIATNPFNFVAAVPGKGCTAPYSAAVIPGGLCFVDTRTQRVYAYVPGGQPESIGETIENELFQAIIDPEAIQGSYNAKHMEYSILVPTSSTYQRIWTFNFRTKGWSYEELPYVNSIGDVDSINEQITIDSLQGSIDTLTGTIDSLLPTKPISSQRVYGLNTGDIYVQSNSSTGAQSPPFSELPSTTYTTLTAQVVSKNYYTPVHTQGIMKMKFEFIIKSRSTVNLYYSKDSGVSWILAKTVTFNPSDETQLLIYHRYIRSRKFTWKITSDLSYGNGLWELIDYELHYAPSGKTVRDF